jgi:hypothetical protein
MKGLLKISLLIDIPVVSETCPIVFNALFAYLLASGTNKEWRIRDILVATNIGHTV